MAESEKPARIRPRLFGQGKKILLDCKVPSQLEAIEKLAEAVNRELPDPDLAFAANLCLEELIINTIVYGLKSATDRFIHVQLSITGPWLEIVLKDDAPRFDPFMQAPKPNLELNIGERPIGGLGVHIVKKLMDETQASYDGNGNTIVLRKRLPEQIPE